MGANIVVLSQRSGSFNFGKRRRLNKGRRTAQSIGLGLRSLKCVATIDLTRTHFYLDGHSDQLSQNLQHPRSLEEIMKCTRFTKAEIRLLYRSFKQVRVTSLVDR